MTLASWYTSIDQMFGIFCQENSPFLTLVCLYGVELPFWHSLPFAKKTPIFGNGKFTALISFSVFFAKKPHHFWLTTMTCFFIKIKSKRKPTFLFSILILTQMTTDPPLCVYQLEYHLFICEEFNFVISNCCSFWSSEISDKDVASVSGNV